MRWNESGGIYAIQGVWGCSSSFNVVYSWRGVGGWMWDQQIQHFAHYHCVIPELMSHDPFSIEHSAKELLLLIEEKANEKPVIVIGFSLGAQIAIQMLSLKPSLIDYTIINSALVIPSPTVERMLQPFIRLSFPLIKIKHLRNFKRKPSTFMRIILNVTIKRVPR